MKKNTLLSFYILAGATIILHGCSSSFLSKKSQPANHMVELNQDFMAARGNSENTISNNFSSDEVKEEPSIKNQTPIMDVQKSTSKSELKKAVKSLLKENKTSIKDLRKTLANDPTAENKEMSIMEKSKVAAALLCFFLGCLGIHRFYLGYTWQGIAQLLTAGGCGIWALIDFIRILTGDLKAKDGTDLVD